nr:capsule assembly Wzi family protein [Gramella jeungdoensis]
MSGFQVFSQVDFSGSLNLQGYYSNKEKLPFWFYSNQRGRISEETTMAGWISGKMDYTISEKSSLEIGGGLLYQDDYLNDDFIDELYIDFKYSKFSLIAGRKHYEELYNGLSAANENFAWSLNASPMPGIQIKTDETIYFNQNEKLGFEFSWAEYLMGNDRFVKGTRLHSKSLYLVYNLNQDWILKGGIRHFAQWGGKSPVGGSQPTGLKDYFMIITGREGGENALVQDQQNVLGSHLGTYELYLSRELGNLRFRFIYNHYFEDGTGSRYANFPDGRYGFYFENKEENSLFQSWIYEFYYTRNQSMNSSAPHKYDYYFWNGIYRSGWTYQDQIIGVPFFDFDEETPIITGNKFLAHHIGLAGNFNNYFLSYPFKLLATYVRKDGTLSKRYTPNRDEIYLSYEMGLLKEPFKLCIMLGAEYSNVAKPVYGAGLSLSKQF